MRKIIFSLCVLVLAGLMAIVLVGRKSAPEEASPEGREFMQKIFEVGSGRVGQPIEGFDAGLYISAFPGLAEADFSGAETIGGKLAYENGELSFIRRAGWPISTADKTISGIGHETLLKNLRSRLGEEVPINEIIKLISFEEFADLPDGATESPRIPPAVSIAITYASERVKVNENEVLLLKAAEKNWPNACLGLPSEGEMCAEVITPGYEITLRAGSREVVYRVNGNGSVVRLFSDEPIRSVRIDSFEECAAAGNPIMESYPRQCRAPEGEIFTEIIAEAPVACAEEAKLCPDGSSVGRAGPNCEFPACP